MQFNKVNNKDQYKSAVQLSLRAVVVSIVWPGHVLVCFLTHMAALVGDLAGFVVPPSLPSLFFPLLVLVLGT